VLKRAGTDINIEEREIEMGIKNEIFGRLTKSQL